jgi:23S rRNA pseudouridine2604 synthase
MSDTTRLNKFLSESGHCSRREADRLIDAGRVRVNGAVAVVGTQVGPADVVEVEGKVVTRGRADDAVYIAFNKPIGVICTTDPTVRDNIIDAVRHPRRVFPVGRLDVASEGLILLTSDGDVVNKILRAGNAHEKEYEVTVDRPIDASFLHRMANGVPILDTTTLPCRIRQDTKTRFTLILTQGLNRQIRRMCEALGYGVAHLRRTRIMNIHLGDLPAGRWRDLTPAELTDMHRRLSKSSKTPLALPDADAD